MKRLFFGLSLLGLCGLMSGARHNDAGLVVHEWGTFLAMSGSDGVTLDGMYHEEHALPPFVHARSKDQLHMRSVSLKGETPVVYFYTDRRQDINVCVQFPQGIWTQWYPQAAMVAPGLAATHTERPEHGRICWNLEVVPPSYSILSGELPATQSDALWNYARQVDADYVQTHDSPGLEKPRETERFIFYRGLGRANLPLHVSSADGGTLKLGSLPGSVLKHLFVIRVENGMANFRYVPSLTAGESITRAIPSMQGATDIASFSGRIGQDLADRLTDSGLYRKEAEAMVNTWRKSYFESDGVRVLFVLPQQWTESFIPMDVSPKPAKLVRVMVGRTELLTPEREARAEAAIKNLNSKDASVREQAFSYLRAQGRYIEPVVNRVLRSTQDESTRRVCKALLLTDFVTELRSAVHSAADGSKIEEKPGEARAHLSALLHEIGQTEQASEEARRAEQELSQIPAPKMANSDSRWYLRAYARCKEGLGDDRAAAGYYEKMVRFGSQSKTCGNCHAAAGPKNMAFYRDWWAGRKYAEYVEKLGIREAVVREQKEVLSRHPSDTAAQMLLAYASAGHVDQQANDRLWAAIEGKSGRVAVKEASER